MVRRHTRSFVAAVLVAAFAPAQERRPAFVRVVDAVGQPVAGADVTVGWAPGTLLPGEPELLRARTDGRGRAQPSLVVGRVYSAWAVGPSDDRGARLCGEPDDDVVAGGILELRLSERRLPQRVAVDGVDACCPDEGAEVVFLPFPIASAALPLERRDGCVEVPPGPVCTTWLGVRNGSGDLLQAFELPMLGLGDADETDLPEVHFEAAERYQVALRDPGGAAVTDGVAAFEVLELVRPGAVSTDVVGCFEVPLVTRVVADAVDVFVHQNRKRNWFVVRADGCASRMVNDAAVLFDGVEVAMLDRGTWSGELRGLAEGEEARLGLRARLGEVDGRRYVERLLPIAVEGGRLRLPITAHMLEHRIVGHLTDGRAVPRLVWTEPRGGPPESLDLDLGALTTLRLKVVDRERRLVPGARVAIADPRGHLDAPCIAMVGTDLAGRLDLLWEANDDEGVLLYVSDGRSHAFAFLEAGDEDEQVEVRLEPMATLRCRVVDAAGRAVPGARLEVVGAGAFSGEPPEPGREARRALAWRVARPLLTGARSDANGMLAAPVQTWLRWQASVRVRAGGLVSATFPVQVGEVGRVVVR